MSRLKMNSNPNHNYIGYISNFAYCTLYCVFCSLCLLSGESVGHDMDGMNKKFQISDDEIIHRRQLVAPHLLGILEKQKDWIETYHFSFDGDWQGISSDNIADSVFSTSKSIPLNPEEHSHRNEIDEDFPPELNNLDIEISHLNSNNINSEISSHHLDEVKNIVSNDKFEINTKKSISKHRTVDSISPEFTKMKKDIKIHPLTASSGEQDTSVDEKILGSVSRENIVTEESENENIDFDLSKNAGKEKIIETRNLNSETKELNSVPSKFEKSESVSPKDKFTLNSEEVISINSEDIHSNPKIVDAHSSELSKPDLDQNESNQRTVDNTKEKSLNNVQELTDLKDKEINSHKIEDSMLFEVIPDKKDEESSNILSVSREEINVKLPIVNEELPKRQSLVKSFVTSLDKKKENWKETYHFNYYKETNSGEVWESLYSDSHILDQEVENIAVKVLEPLQIRERSYFIRWLNKLLNKFPNYPYNKNISINFSFTTDIVSNLRKLSESKKIDINTADVLISELISNATVQYGYNFNDFYDMFANVSFYIFVSIIFSVLLYFILYYYPISRFILPFLIFVSWHAFKMYQEKVAQKHAIVSATAPAYCESILTTESGIFAHIKEYIRYNTYDEHCKTYFKALMIDPASELSLPIVLADFVSATFFQLFLPMAHALNAFVKILFFDLSFVQTFYLFMLVAGFVFFCIVRTLIYNRYKLKFPFFIGSLEPSATPVGSRVEELVLENNTVKASPVKLISDKYDTLFIHEKRDCVNLLTLHKNDCRTMKLMQFKRRFSF